MKDTSKQTQAAPSVPEPHTPGPWSTHGGQVIQDANGRDIAKAWLAHGNQQLPTTANARLIASAPELLTALRLLLTEELPTETLARKISEGKRQIAREAIAKATGQK